MTRLDREEMDLLKAYERGELESVATPDELARIREAARATGTKDRRINIRLSSGELSALQVLALQEGMPYQTLISSVLHKYVTGRLVEVDDPRFAGLGRTASQERGARDRPST